MLLCQFNRSYVRTKAFYVTWSCLENGDYRKEEVLRWRVNLPEGNYKIAQW